MFIFNEEHFETRWIMDGVDWAKYIYKYKEALYDLVLRRMTVHFLKNQKEKLNVQILFNITSREVQFNTEEIYIIGKDFDQDLILQQSEASRAW